ncbi:MAG: GNAT family N-acetyltransferase [Candidatus Asgardarchaeia archaeon]|nr:MAG: hypothetical protein DRO67_03810 [Candidatus Asgardarchaeum californiense]
MLFPKLSQKVVHLKNGKVVNIRLATTQDDEKIWNMVLRLSESTMMFLRPEGFTRSDIDNWLTESELDTMAVFVAEHTENNQQVVVALGLIYKGQFQHSHVAELSIVVRDDFQSVGLGTQMTQFMIDYARARGLKKLILRVYADNERAYHMYRKLGFEIEGVFLKEAFVAGKYRTIYRMCKFLD